MTLSVGSLLVIALTVLSWGLILSVLFDRLGRSYLVTIGGGRACLRRARIIMWTIALLISIGAWFVLAPAMQSTVALALFFGLEAGVLDICVHRVRFVYVS